jgi:hypothetical protein
MSKYVQNFSHENDLTIDDGTGYFQALNKDGDYGEVTLSELFGRKAS